MAILKAFYDLMTEYSSKIDHCLAKLRININLFTNLSYIQARGNVCVIQGKIIMEQDKLYKVKHKM